MKKIVIFLAIAQVFSLSIARISLAGQKMIILPALTVSAYIPENPSPELNFKVVSLDYSGVATGGEKTYEQSVLEKPSSFQDSTALNFGPLVHKSGDIEVDGWFSKKAFVVMLYANSFGRQYRITSSCNGLFGAGDPIKEAFVVAPGYAWNDRFVWKQKDPNNPTGPDIPVTRDQGTADNPDPPAGSQLGVKGTGAETGKLIYQSESPGTKRIIQLWLSIPAPDKNGNDPYTGWKKIPLTQKGGSYSGTVTITMENV